MQIGEEEETIIVNPVEVPAEPSPLMEPVPIIEPIPVGISE
jgi:hypothetical protein